MDIIIKNALIINEGKRFEGSVWIKNGLIFKIYSGEFNPVISDSTEIVDAGKRWLIPGVIDDQVHFRDPGLTHKADFFSESRAAAAGGVTSVMDMPNTKPQTITIAELEKKFEMGMKKSLVNYSFYFGATNENIDEIKKIDPKRVCGLKVFMGASTGNMLVDKPESLDKIFAQAPCLVAVHCEDEITINKNTTNFKDKYGDDIPIHFHPQIRSEEACYLSSSLAVKLARKHHTRLHILHLSTAKELSLFDADIPLKEKKITAEVCVHHLWFDNRDYEKLGTLIKWNPAIKTKSDRDQLLEAVKTNKLDVIATDHAPHTIEEKKNRYFEAPSGGPLVQHSLQSMLELARNGKISLETVINKMCHAPADLFRIKKRGYIREGFWADLVLIDPNTIHKVQKSNILYKCGWSPFENYEFHTSVWKTYINGKLIYDNGKVNETDRGMALEFD
ncbi:MAG: dihydroorotase [Bacteroidota bacterium]|nr:dihydroorotase [Bacteroidota bacterium]